MSQLEDYLAVLKTRPDWDDFLRAESGLPGPRGNLELAYAVAAGGDETRFLHLISIDQAGPEKDTPNMYLVFCGIVGLGNLLAAGKKEYLSILKQYANDERWRLREGVAMALQTWGKTDMETLLCEMEQWGTGTALEQRAAAAALCEPALLKRPEQVKRVLLILDAITTALTKMLERKSAGFEALRKGLAYCWSVAVAAAPVEGKPFIEKWVAVNQPDVRWIMKENLKKNRLIKMDSAWVEMCLGKIT